MAGDDHPSQAPDEPDATYWVVFEVSSLQQVRFLAEAEQVRIYGRFKLFLDGLGFPLKFISLVEAADPERDPALVAQRQALSELAATPHLQQLQQESLQHQQGALQHSTTIRHFVVVSASTGELERLRADGIARSPLLRLCEHCSRRRRTRDYPRAGQKRTEDPCFHRQESAPATRRACNAARRCRSIASLCLLPRAWHAHAFF